MLSFSSSSLRLISLTLNQLAQHLLCPYLHSTQDWSKSILNPSYISSPNFKLLYWSWRAKILVASKNQKATNIIKTYKSLYWNAESHSMHNPPLLCSQALVPHQIFNANMLDEVAEKSPQQQFKVTQQWVQS